MIIRGGYSVYPREIEEVFYEHPAVGEAAVVGLRARSGMATKRPMLPPSRRPRGHLVNPLCVRWDR